MSQENMPDSAKLLAEQGNDLSVEKSIVIPTIIILLMIALPAIFFTEKTAEVLTALFNPLNRAFGSSFLWIITIFTLYLVYIALSKYGNIKFGEKDEKPDYKLFEWSAMIFTSGVAGAVLFWAIVEPSWYVLTPPRLVEPKSAAAYEWSIALLLLNWGPTAWCSYFVCALPIAYMFHIKRKPLLRVSTATEIVIGSQKDKFLGRVLDSLFILGIMFCTAVAMCISLPTVEAALVRVFPSLEPSLALQGQILLATALISITSVYLGLDKGIKVVSSFNIKVAIAIVLYVFFVGPTVTIFDTFTSGIGLAANNFLSTVLWTDVFTDGTVPQDWTMFYAMYWLGYGPFMGLFIARISRGRTIKEIITYGLASAVLGGYFIHGVLASYTLYLSHNNVIDVLGILVEQGGANLMMEVFMTLPFGYIILIAYCFVSTIFLATSINSSCYVMAASVTKRIGIHDDPHKLNLVMWVVVVALLAMGSLSIGGLQIAKMLGNFSGMFICIPILLMAYSWLKILKQDGKELLEKWAVKE